MADHCRHCEDECPGGLPIPAWPHPEPHMNDDGAEWPEGKCPACAEAERIAVAVEADIERMREVASPWLVVLGRGLTRGAKIARGKP